MIRSAGKSVSTIPIDNSAPRARSRQIDPIRSMFEYTATPIVAAKKPSAEEKTEFTVILKGYDEAKKMGIIKKIAAAILAASLCVGGAALAEETPEVTPGDFLDEWVDLDGT